MLKIYHNTRCKKSRETLQLIEEAGAMVEVIEYLKVTPTAEELGEIVQKLGIKPEELIRKNEAVYKEQYKGKDLSDTEWLNTMVANPKLIERPIVVKGDEAIIGRPPENVKKLF